MAPQTASLSELASEHTFKIVLWVGVFLCITAFALRLTIRIICFQRLLVEDYLMVFALSAITSIVVILHIYLADIYLMSVPPEASDMPHQERVVRLTAAWRADGVAVILSMLGIWTIKMNFMLFFHRFGHQIKAFQIFWWVAAVVIITGGAVLLGVIPYDCVFLDLAFMRTHCSTMSKLGLVYSFYQANVAVDILCDFLIIVFPILILWNTKITLRQKLFLSSIFSLVVFTVTVTIIRGSIFGDIYKSVEEANHKGFDPSWMVFWFFIELIVSFIVACLVTFRSLWSSKRYDNRKHRIELERQRAVILAQQRHRPMGSSAAMKGFHAMHKRWGSLLDSLADLEGTILERNMPENHSVHVPSETLTAEFPKFSTVDQPASGAKSSQSSHSTRDSSVNSCGGLDRWKWVNEQALVGEDSLLQHAEPQPSYHRPGTAV